MNIDHIELEIQWICLSDFSICISLLYDVMCKYICTSVRELRYNGMTCVNSGACILQWLFILWCAWFGICRKKHYSEWGPPRYVYDRLYAVRAIRHDVAGAEGSLVSTLLSVELHEWTRGSESDSCRCRREYGGRLWQIHIVRLTVLCHHSSALFTQIKVCSYNVYLPVITDLMS